MIPHIETQVGVMNGMKKERSPERRNSGLLKVGHLEVGINLFIPYLDYTLFTPTPSRTPLSGSHSVGLEAPIVVRWQGL
jgi:hypothetical protein